MKNTREIASEYRMGHWAGIMRERIESGLSITKFCEREGMHVNRYHYWQRRLRLTAMAEMQGSQREDEQLQLPPAGWSQVSTPVEPEETDAAQINQAGLTIEIGKCRVNAKENVTSELLRKVCRVLVELC